MTRKEFYAEIADYSDWFETAEFKRHFEFWYGVEPVDILKRGYDFERDVKWNETLERAYNDRIEADRDFEECEEFINEFDDYESNMPCDFSGYCSGTNCPNFYKCQG